MLHLDGILEMIICIAIYKDIVFIYYQDEHVEIVWADGLHSISLGIEKIKEHLCYLLLGLQLILGEE